MEDAINFFLVLGGHRPPLYSTMHYGQKAFLRVNLFNFLSNQQISEKLEKVTELLV